MSAALRRAEIIEDLTHIPDSALDEIQAYVRAVLNKAHRPPQSRQSLAGIWRGKGFEKIVDLEAELREARKEMTGSIARRKI